MLNRASIVVPGYCTCCGGFLGDAATTPAKPETIWVARQVGQMLATEPLVTPDGVRALVELVIERMAAGQVARFARMLNLSKSGVWHWVRQGGVPSLQAWLAVALHGGIGMDRLFAGNLDDWSLPVEPVQMTLPLPSPRKHIKSRTLDWTAIRYELRAMLDEEQPITLGEACKRVGVDYKHLYLKANPEARAIADRHRRHQAAIRARRENHLKDTVSSLLRERLATGYDGISARDVLPRLDADLKAVRNIYGHIQSVMAANE